MAIKISKTFYPKTRAAWRSWLKKNHATKSEIWLLRYKKTTGRPTVDYQDSVDEALCFGWIDGFEKGIDAKRFATRFTPRRAKSGWSESNVKRYKSLVKAGRMTSAGTAAFKRKRLVYAPHAMTAAGRRWHLAHRMPINPSLTQRITWHRAHQRICGCREIPKSLQSYVPAYAHR